jgi:hypothetical protein
MLTARIEKCAGDLSSRPILVPTGDSDIYRRYVSTWGLHCCWELGSEQALQTATDLNEERSKTVTFWVDWY